MQRIEGLRIVSSVRGDIALAERGHPQVNEGARQFRAAETTFRQQ